MKTVLNSSQEFTQLVLNTGIATWEDLLLHVKGLPYGRNANRSNFKLVLIEGCGSCSSKHAFLKSVADENEVPQVELILAMYKMRGQNTKGVSTILDRYHLDYIPEAHCFLRVNGECLDLTSSSSNIDRISEDILEEEVIHPVQVVEYKVEKHQSFLRKWLINSQLPYTFDEIWSIREECIGALSL